MSSERERITKEGSGHPVVRHQPLYHPWDHPWDHPSSTGSTPADISPDYNAIENLQTCIWAARVAYPPMTRPRGWISPNVSSHKDIFSIAGPNFLEVRVRQTQDGFSDECDGIPRTRENFDWGKLANRELFAKIFLANIHRYTENA